jgi:Leucine rich repeat
LSFNTIENIADNAFNGLTKLRELFLNDNFLSIIKADDSATLKNIKVLKLQNNKFIAANFLSPYTPISSADLNVNKCIDMNLKLFKKILKI